MGLIRSLFWFAIFLAATFVFTVIFEHGFEHFSENSKREYEVLKAMVTGGKVQRQADQSDKVVP